MKTAESISDLRLLLNSAPRPIGFVPTMGFLHQGHLSLVEASIRENKTTVVSIYVNPLQFAPGEDFKQYPRDPEADRRMLSEIGTDVLFMPSDLELFPAGFGTQVEVPAMSEALCGRHRPGHFRGVATIVLKLFNLVKPDSAYFGRKDAQQALIIKRMSRDLNLDLKIRTLPTVRDRDGLALSSRNSYLSPEERKKAPALSAALREAERLVSLGEKNTALIKQAMLAVLDGTAGIETEYCETVSLDTMRPLETVEPGNTLIAVAVRIGGTRLIDNTVIGDLDQC